MLEKFNSIYNKLRKDGRLDKNSILAGWNNCHVTVDPHHEERREEVYLSTFDRALRDLWKFFSTYRNSILPS
jgi:hypothetical protein